MSRGKSHVDSTIELHNKFFLSHDSWRFVFVIHSIATTTRVSSSLVYILLSNIYIERESNILRGEDAMRSDDDHSPILDNSIFDYNPKGKSCKKLYNLLFLETGFWNKVCAAIQFEDG